VDNFIGTLMTVLEPALVVFLGIGIGIVVVALYLPIFGLTSAMAGG